MSIKLTSLLLLLSASLMAQKTTALKNKAYFPPPQYWQHKTPTESGLDSLKIQEAIAFHKENEIKNPRSMEQSHYQSFGKEPYGYAIGPFADRGERNVGRCWDVSGTRISAAIPVVEPREPCVDECDTPVRCGLFNLRDRGDQLRLHTRREHCRACRVWRRG